MDGRDTKYPVAQSPLAGQSSTAMYSCAEQGVGLKNLRTAFEYSRTIFEKLNYFGGSLSDHRVDICQPYPQKSPRLLYLLLVASKLWNTWFPNVPEFKGIQGLWALAENRAWKSLGFWTLKYFSAGSLKILYKSLWNSLGNVPEILGILGNPWNTVKNYPKSWKLGSPGFLKSL